MAIEDWQLTPYQTAAAAVLQKLGEDPYQLVQFSNGDVKPRWLLEAIKMHVLRLQMQAMSDYGPYGPA
jgi:hypothetical protein